MDQYASDDHHGMEWNLTKMRSVLSIRCLPSAVEFIFFSDEKIFTVAAPVSLQNDRVYTVNLYSVQIKYCFNALIFSNISSACAKEYLIAARY